MLELTTLQGTTAPAPAPPQGPAIPPVPTRPGAGTGATPTPDVGHVAGDPVQNAANAIRNAADAIQNSTQPQVIVQPPYRNNNNDIPPEVIPLVGMVMGTVMAIVLGYPIIRFIIKMIERKADRSTLPAKDVAAQLRALQDSVDTMAIELERISEGQRFTAKLMAEREQRALGEGQPR